MERVELALHDRGPVLLVGLSAILAQVPHERLARRHRQIERLARHGLPLPTAGKRVVPHRARIVPCHLQGLLAGHLIGPHAAAALVIEIKKFRGPTFDADLKAAGHGNGRVPENADGGGHPTMVAPIGTRGKQLGIAGAKLLAYKASMVEETYATENEALGLTRPTHHYNGLALARRRSESGGTCTVFWSRFVRSARIAENGKGAYRGLISKVISRLGPRGGVVTQRSAKPFTPVQFWSWPPF
jgi:hypothetical protein